MPSYSVPPGNALLTQDGGVGIFFVATPFEFKAGATVRVVSDTQPPVDLRVAQVHPETGAVTVLSASGGYKPDITAYLVADGARAIQDAQLISTDTLYVEVAGQAGSMYADVMPRDPDPEVYLPVRLTNGSSWYNATGGGSGGGTVDQGQAGTDPWAVDASGSVVVLAEPTSVVVHYDEVSNVASGVEQDILTIIAPPGGLCVKRVMVSGDNIAVYRVKVGGVVVATKRSGWLRPSEDFDFDTGLVIPAGVELSVTGLHTRPSVATFEASAVAR